MSHRLGSPTAEACPELAHAGAAPIARHDEQGDRRAVNRAVGISAVGLFATGAVELIIALLTGSVSLLADAFHNLSDVSTSLVVFLGFRVSRRLPSRRYPYGYDRAEDLAGLGVALVIWASAVFAIAESVRKLTEHGTTSHIGAGIAAAALGVVGNQLVARYKLRVGRRVQSATLVSDAQHSWLDALSSAGALAGLIAVAAGWRYGDPIAGFAVALFICHVGWEVTHDLVSRLMDGIDPELLHTAEHAAADVPGVRHAHARGRWTGRQLNIDLEAWSTRTRPWLTPSCSGGRSSRRSSIGSPRSGGSPGCPARCRMRALEDNGVNPPSRERGEMRVDTAASPCSRY